MVAMLLASSVTTVFCLQPLLQSAMES